MHYFCMFAIVPDYPEKVVPQRCRNKPKGTSLGRLQPNVCFPAAIETANRHLI